jgi:hypothetical protein
MAPDEPSISSGNRGPILTTNVLDRTVTGYLIQESEMEHLSSLGARATRGFAAASFVASAIVSLYGNAIFYAELTPAGKLAELYIGPALGVICLYFIGGACWALRERNQMLTRIKGESRARQP